MGKRIRPEEGIFKKAANPGDPDVRVVDVSYENDALAEMIVEAWSDTTFYNQLTGGTTASRGNHAQAALAERGIYLTNPIVLKEKEFNEGWDVDDDDQVVFVLPNKNRATTGGKPLLETAKLLMASVPNGI